MKVKLSFFEWGKQVYELLGKPHSDDRYKKLNFLASIYNHKGIFAKLYIKELSPEAAVAEYEKEAK